MSTVDMARVKLTEPELCDLRPASRGYLLREAYWSRRHVMALDQKALCGSGADTISGHARDFAYRLSLSEPRIWPDELIVGAPLVQPLGAHTLDAGYYNPHCPPGYGRLMALGLTGIRDESRHRLTTERDPAKRDYLQGVAIAYDGAIAFVSRYEQLARQMLADESDPARHDDLTRIADACHELTIGPPTSFHGGWQLLQFVRLFGARGCIGRVDQWLYPLYAHDVAAGTIDQRSALELIECAFVKMNEFSAADELVPETCASWRPSSRTTNDDLRNITLAGQTETGDDAANSLTLLCLAASGRLMLPEPKVNVRLFEGTDESVLSTACHVLARGANVVAFYNDDVAIPSLEMLGIPLADARDYVNDGCSELIIPGQSTISLHVYDSIAILSDLLLGLDEQPPTLDDLLRAFKTRLVPCMHRDIQNEMLTVTHPFFSATIDDVLDSADPAAVRYPIIGAILAQVGNSADGLAAVRKLVYEDKSVTWQDLTSALQANYDGYEPLRQMILNRAHHYGNDLDDVDGLAKEIAEFYCDGVLERGDNEPGPGPKWAPGLMCFGLEAKAQLPASPDGRRQGDPTANSFSPSVGADRCGPTAVLKSAAKVDLTKAGHGSVLDIALHGSVLRSDEDVHKLTDLVRTFQRLGSAATLQLNVIDRETLVRAQQNPDAPEFRSIIVRVWGFSAVFVDLPLALQNHVLARTGHRL